MGRISHLFQMLLNFANDTEDGLDFFMYLSDASVPKTLFAPLNSGFADNEVSKQDELSEPQRRAGVTNTGMTVWNNLGKEEECGSERTSGLEVPAQPLPRRAI